MMQRQKMRVLTGTILVLVALVWAGGDGVWAAATSMGDAASNIAVTIGKAVAAATAPGKPTNKVQAKRLENAQRAAAAKSARLLGLKPGVAGRKGVTLFGAAAPLPAPEGPGGVPHYFGPYANWAF